MSDAGPLATHISDSKAFWYHRVGGGVMSAQTLRSVLKTGSRAQRSPHRANLIHVGDLLMDDPNSPAAASSTAQEEGRNVASKVFLLLPEFVISLDGRARKTENVANSLCWGRVSTSPGS